jgi:hypothetical protein
LQIADRRPDACGIVAVAAQSGIAFAAQQAAHPAGLVAVVDAERFRRLPLADSAGAVLPPQQRGVFVQRKSVDLLQLVGARVPRTRRGQAFLAIFRIGRPFVPGLGVDLILVSGVVTKVGRQRLASKLRILGIALAFAVRAS